MVYREVALNPTKEALRRFALGTLQQKYVVEGSYCMGRDWAILLRFKDENALEGFRENLGRWLTYEGPRKTAYPQTTETPKEADHG